MPDNNNNTTSLHSVQACLHAIQRFYNDLKTQKTSIIDAGNLLLLEMERDDAAYETLYHLNDVIIPDMNRALEKAEELILYLSGYAQMLIDTYNHNNGGE